MMWRIGDWVACSDSDTVRCASVQHKLERRAMEVLVMLAERAGQVVRKDELIEAVWGRLAVSDHSVAMVISQLRRALRDDARAPKYIETITKRGYRLIAPCEPVAEQPARRATVPVPMRTTVPAQMITARKLPSQAAMVVVSAGVVLAGAGALSALLLF